MKKVILIKYGELTTKKDNRNYFIRTLRDNIITRLSSFDYDIQDDYYRMFIIPKNDDVFLIADALKDVFGIHEIVITLFDEDSSVDTIKKLSLDVVLKKEGKTFKVITNRSDKNYPIHSMKMNDIIGGHILRNTKLKVDVHNPDIRVDIEIRREGVYVYDEVIEGLRGYPVGTLGSALLMLSGGIDSPVAGYLTIKRGVGLNYIYFESRPHTSIEARNKVISLAKKLERYNNGGKLYVINFTKIQETIYKELDPDYLITFMRRRMYEIAVKLAKRNHDLAIVNGESVGQVASQTLTSIACVNDVTNFPILRPLCSFDKLDIIDIAKKIDTYETSILPYEDCCTVFVPRHPVINPRIQHIYHEEQKYDFTDLVNEAVETAEVIDLHKENKSDLL